jgi:60 kDa SS-A/Ro ribonucleoprotein
MSHRGLNAAIAANKNPAVTAPIRGREKEMKQTNTAGFAFAISPEKHIERFLILGDAGSCYHASNAKLTADAVAALDGAIANGHSSTIVKMATEISVAGRAPKNDPALLALAAVAMNSTHDSERAEAYAALPKVARISTHLFHFVDYCREIKGRHGAGGNGLKRAVERWYKAMEPVDMAYQVVKYQSRDGWSHRDVLRRYRPTFKGDHSTVARWAVGKPTAEGHELPTIIQAFEEAKTASKSRLIELIVKHRLTREMVPSEKLVDPEVMMALLKGSPLTALIRNLGNFGKLNLLDPFSEGQKIVEEKLSDAAALKKARVHPISVLLAIKTYGSGHGMRGSGEWKVNGKISAALEDAFYATFKTIEPSGKNTIMALDISGSMSGGEVCGLPGLAPMEVTAVMAMATVRSEPNTHVVGFGHTLHDLKINEKTSLEGAMQAVQGPFESTNISLPFVWAKENKIKAEAFAVYTDNEVNCGTHPSVAKKSFDQALGVNSRLVVCATSLTDFTVADPKDPASLDIAGFDASAPSLISDFFAGRAL